MLNGGKAMYNVITTAFPEAQSIIPYFRKIPEVLIESNFQQILGMVREGSLNKLCIWWEIWNLDGGVPGNNAYRGQTGAEKVHEINPDIPILIWSGRTYEQDDNGPVIFHINGKPYPIKYANELYIDDVSVEESRLIYDFDQVQAITARFFNGTLCLEGLNCTVKNQT